MFQLFTWHVSKDGFPSLAKGSALVDVDSLCLQKQNDGASYPFGEDGANAILWEGTVKVRWTRR